MFWLLAVMFPVAVLLFWQIQRLASALHAVDHSDRVIAQVHIIENQIVDLETGMRGFAITGERSFLDPYQKALADLPKSIRQFKELGRQATEQIARMDQVERKLTQWHDYARRVIGLKESGADPSGLVHSREGKKIIDSIRVLDKEILSTEEQLRDVRAAVSGREMWITSIIGFIAFFVSGLLLFRNLIARRRRELALLESEERFRLLVDGVRCYGIYRMDPNGYIQTWNAGAERVKGYQADEVIEKHYSIFFTPEARGDGHPDRGLEIARTKGRHEEEDWRVRKDGSRFWANCVLTAIYDGRGNVNGFAKITRDLTERKRREDDLHKLNEELEARVQQRTEELARSNQDLEQFATIASHDLKEPLRTVDMFASLLAKRFQGKLDPSADEMISFVVNGTRRMKELIDDLLEYARAGTIKRELAHFGCKDIVEEALYNLRTAIEESGAQVTVNCLPTIKGDRIQLVQVFQNLIANAIKFRGKDIPRIHISAHSNGNTELRVQDNGIGFDSEHAERIFDAFSRLHTREEIPGTGLGLSVCKRVVERHGGRIWAESKPGEGSILHFTLPPAEKAEVRRSVRQPGQERPSGIAS